MSTLHVMVATDGSDAAVDAANRAIRLLHPDARITLVTVVDARHDPMEDAGGFEGPVITDAEADADYEQSVAAGQAALADTAARIDAPVEDQQLVASGEPIDKALREIVAEQRPDLLVLGSESRNWFHRFLHGSIDDRLLHHAPCPILVVAHDSSS
jgi:nucleotide-binding universal stress UspA family protein